MSNNLLLHTNEGREFLLTPFGLYFIGRDRACDVAFPSDTILSSRHAVVFSDGRYFYILDYKSRNGIAVNSTPKKSHRLRDGDVINIGNQNLRVTEDESGRKSSPKLFERDEGDPIVNKLVLLNRAASAMQLETDMTRLRKRVLRMTTDIFRGRRGVFVTPGTLPPFKLEAHVGFHDEPDIFQKWCLPLLVHCHDKRIPVFSSLKLAAPDDPKVHAPDDHRLDFDAYGAFPIRLGGEWYGLVAIYRRPSDPSFSREEIGLLSLFTRYAALALKSAQKLQSSGLA